MDRREYFLELKFKTIVVRGAHRKQRAHSTGHGSQYHEGGHYGGHMRMHVRPPRPHKMSLRASGGERVRGRLCGCAWLSTAGRLLCMDGGY
jgi:hypothetical protein